MHDMEQMGGWIQTQVVQKSRQAEAQKNLYFHKLVEYYIKETQFTPVNKKKHERGA